MAWTVWSTRPETETPSAPRRLNDRRIRAINYRLDNKPERLREVGRLAAARVITPVISNEIAFDDVLATLRRQRDGGARGKVIIHIQAR